jgi:hypothetical protein
MWFGMKLMLLFVTLAHLSILWSTSKFQNEGFIATRRMHVVIARKCKNAYTSLKSCIYERQSYIKAYTYKDSSQPEPGNCDLLIQVRVGCRAYSRDTRSTSKFERSLARAHTYNIQATNTRPNPRSSFLGPFMILQNSNPTASTLTYLT